jgi:monomeric isocitrate dehydrogenase
MTLTANDVSSNHADGEVYSIHVKHYVIKFVSGRSVIFSGFSDFLYQKNWLPRYSWNIVESGVNHHNPNPNLHYDAWL